MNAFKALLLGSALSVAVIASANAAFISIDEFNGPDMFISEGAVGNYVLTDNQATLAGVTPGAASPVSNVIGGYRDLMLEVTANPLPTMADSTSFTTLVGGFFSHSQDNNVQSSSTLKYDGLGSAGLNANFAGLTGIEIGVLTADLGIEWTFVMTDGDGDTATAIFDSPAAIASLTLFTLDFGSDFDFVGSFNFADIDVITFQANSQFTASVDTSIDYIRAIPEPATLALFGAGLLGLGFARRRKVA